MSGHPGHPDEVHEALREGALVASDAGLGHRLALTAPAWVGMVVLWVLLWGAATPANLLSGAGVATAIALLVHPGEREPLGRVRPLAALRLGAFVAWLALRSTVTVAGQVLSAGPQPPSGIIAVSLPSATPALLTLITNAIGLTPGTLVVAIDDDPCVLYVHVLRLADETAARREIRHLELLTLRAFGPPDAGGDIELLEELEEHEEITEHEAVETT